MANDGWIDRAASRGAGRGGKYAENNRRAQEVATVYISVVRGAPGQSDFRRIHPEPVSDEGKHIDVAGGLTTAL